ncbi:YraN family protein [Candidatus Methylocalor cossyra]|uniref:UPF0102 protein MECH1_V1_0284 n=1 Tax=Candidatus Methylocalor cossyra TaxID=3108543 RepID=A0ABM9NEP6_9GAMM
MAAKTPAQRQGRRAEDRVLAFLQHQGLVLLERNYRCRYGEIDLIMEDGPTVVFVEVRFRADRRFGGALESVDRRKQAKLSAAAAHFLQEKRLDRPARFDVAGLTPAADGPLIQWIRDAFQAD